MVMATQTVTTIILILTTVLGLPVNLGTILIFVRRKKLRYLVNFLLLLDSLSHLLVIILLVPQRLIANFMDKNEMHQLFGKEWENFLIDFVNIHGTFLTLSIGILRYRRLCWKKKDAFCLHSGVKWSLVNGVMALSLTLAQILSVIFGWIRSSPIDFTDGYEDNKQRRMALGFFTAKATISFSSIFGVVFCYAGVCWRVLQNPCNQEKARRSKSLHLRAIVHSIVQILLISLTVSTYLYGEGLQLELHHTKSNLFQNQIKNEIIVNQNEIPISFQLTTTFNYALLITGSPLAYLASCHRFREQFWTLFLFSSRKSGPASSTPSDRLRLKFNHPKFLTTSAKTPLAGHTRIEHQIIVSRTTALVILPSASSSSSSAPSTSGSNGKLIQSGKHVVSHYPNSILPLSTSKRITPGEHPSGIGN